MLLSMAEQEVERRKHAKQAKINEFFVIPFKESERFARIKAATWGDLPAAKRYNERQKKNERGGTYLLQ